MLAGMKKAMHTEEGILKNAKKSKDKDKPQQREQRYKTYILK